MCAFDQVGVSRLRSIPQDNKAGSVSTLLMPTILWEFIRRPTDLLR